MQPEWVETVGDVETAKGLSEKVSVWARVTSAADDEFVEEYRNRQSDIFVPTTIGGLPAVQKQSAVNPGSCTFIVGTAVGAALTVLYYQSADDRLPQYDNPCPKARRVTEAVVAALPPLTPK